MSEDRFKIVFEKLEELSEETRDGDSLVHEVQELTFELDETAELRRLTEAILQPPTGSYTST